MFLRDAARQRGGARTTLSTCRKSDVNSLSRGVLNMQILRNFDTMILLFPEVPSYTCTVLYVYGSTEVRKYFQSTKVLSYESTCTFVLSYFRTFVLSYFRTKVRRYFRTFESTFVLSYLRRYSIIHVYGTI